MLREWIDPTKLDYNGLSMNPHDGAIEMLRNAIQENPDKISWVNLSRNQNYSVVEFLDKKGWPWIGKPANNDDEMDSLCKRVEEGEKVDWFCLSKNPHDRAIRLLKENPDKIKWSMLSCNTHDDALDMLKENPEKIDWTNLSGNSNDKAIQMLEEAMNKVDWINLSCNTNYRAIELLRLNPEKIHWGFLSENTNEDAIALLRENLTKINWRNFSRNPAIFLDTPSYVLK
jgi:ribosomal protein L24E